MSHKSNTNPKLFLQKYQEKGNNNIRNAFKLFQWHRTDKHKDRITITVYLIVVCIWHYFDSHICE